MQQPDRFTAVEQRHGHAAHLATGAKWCRHVVGDSARPACGYWPHLNTEASRLGNGIKPRRRQSTGLESTSPHTRYPQSRTLRHASKMGGLVAVSNETALVYLPLQVSTLGE